MFWCLLLLSSVNLIYSTIFHTDPKKPVPGRRARDGSLTSPFNTVADCVSALKYPGDECQIHEGTYREEITISGLHGTEDNPIVIRGFGEERPRFDGTVDIAPVAGTWQRDGQVYYGKISHVIWQLFFDDLMLTNARWPNANWSSKTVFDGRNHWAKTSYSKSKDVIVDSGNALKYSGKDMTGAMAVLNIGSWNTFVAKVLEHSPGTNSFRYDYKDAYGDIRKNLKHGRYFIESKRELLDAPEEWFFDKSTNILYFIPPAGAQVTKTTKLRGKVQTYALTIKDSSDVVVKNIDFFATTLRAIPEFDKGTYVNRVKLDSLNFIYPCASKRMLLLDEVTQCTKVDGRRRRGVARFNSGSFTFFNNTFHGADGIPLSYIAAESRLENNLFTYNDWTSANSQAKDGGHGTIEARCLKDVVIRNTLLYNGEGHGIRPGFNPNVTLNRVVGQCWGNQQNDGAGIHLTRVPQENSRIEQNWVHDSPKYGIRFDSSPGNYGKQGTISENVAFRLDAGGIQMKGHLHKALNNLAFDKRGRRVRPNIDCSLCVWKYVRGSTYEINRYSTTIGNVADVANGGKIWKNGRMVKPVTVRPMNGITSNNVIDRNIKNSLHDPNNEDFRPLTNSISVGPYPYDSSSKNYWIPGRQLYKASSPVPPNGADQVRAAQRDSLMWLNGYGCDTHDVYLGKDSDVVARAGRGSSEYLGTVKDGNVMYLKKGVVVGVKYYWRVDVMCLGKVFTGDVWNFTTV